MKKNDGKGLADSSTKTPDESNNSTPSPVGEGRGGVGLVIRNTGYSYTVKIDDTGEVLECKVKGKFRIAGIRTTNPVAIGDRVCVVPQNEENAGLITAIDDRKNYIIRKSTNLSKQSHIIAANVDMCFLIVTVTHPETSLTFIDRFLASAEAYRVPVSIIFNKVDIVKHAENDTDVDWADYLDGVINLYSNLDYPCFRISAKTGEGVEQLRNELKGKIVCLSGNSGVGKSTLINALYPGLDIKTSEISDAYSMGKHTTTFSEMYATDGGGYIIDTPGIKGFGTFNMHREEIGHYFREIFHFAADCRFNNCTHTHEPHCAVLAALDRHDIAVSRYNSYLSMLDDENEDKYRQGY